jgi:hypothetical protein
VGFLKDVVYDPNRTLFPGIEYANEIISPKKEGITYCLMVDAPVPFPIEKISQRSENGIDAIRIIVGKELSLSNIQAWNKNNIMDFDAWDLRELLSVYWFNRAKDRYTCWDHLKTDFSKIKFICIDDIKNNFQKTILEFLEYFEVDVDTTKLSQLSRLENEWISKQYH